MEVVGIDLALEAVFLVVPPQGPEKRKKVQMEKNPFQNNSAIVSMEKLDKCKWGQ